MSGSSTTKKAAIPLIIRCYGGDGSTTSTPQNGFNLMVGSYSNETGECWPADEPIYAFVALDRRDPRPGARRGS